MKYWAFHCNPKAWDSIKEISEHDDGTWLINKQDEKEIQIGDKFALWVSGKDAGVYAFGEIIDSPKLLKEDEKRASKYAINKTKFDDVSLRVKLKYTDKFQTTPVIRNVILNSIWLNEDTLQYSFFNRPQGVTSRELTDSIFNRLLTLRQDVDKIHEFREYLYGIHKNKSTSEDYLKMVPKIEKWFIENGICDDSYSLWDSNSNINEINKSLNNSKGWKDLNKEESNWYSSPWNKWIEFNAKPKRRFWLYAPGEKARKWDELFTSNEMAIGWDFLKDLSQYSSKEQIEEALMADIQDGKRKYNDALACYEFASVIKPGDIVITKKGKREYVGWGIVAGDYFYDLNQPEYKNRRKVDWKEKGEWIDSAGDIVTKTLTDITKYPDYVKRLTKLLGIEKKESIQMIENIDFPLNTILYGPPGTGKTYNTILRAAQIIEGRVIDSYDEALEVFKANLHDKIEFITFHQNYSYEDFIQGLRPETKEENDQLKFKKSDGIFKVIADRALSNIKESEKAPEELSQVNAFSEALEILKDKILESDEPIKINETAYFTAVEDDAFRYSGDNWTLNDKGFNGFRMKYSDLARFFEEGVEERREIKNLENISGLAKQHATYFIKAFELVKSLMPKSITKTQKTDKKNYVIIIDEINRANISRVFGELITLIEPDKRSHGTIPLEARLPSGDPFIVPSNLFIIGTMNTADKSIALLDIALRRRFEFESMYPKYEIKNQEIYDVEILEKINKQIIKSKGHDFQIGHAYFMGDNKDLVQRMNKKVIPLLLEYYMNDEKEVKGILNSAGLIIEENSWPLKISGKND